MIIIYYLTPTFREVALSLKESLRELGFPVQIAPELSPSVVNDRENIYLLMGLNNPVPYLPPYYIAYQMEQAGSEWFTESYLERLRGALMIWDYSLINIQYLRREHLSFGQTRRGSIYYVPLGYSPCLSIGVDLNQNKTIDILFFGSLNSRRKAIIDQMRVSHPDWRIVVETNIWETERNRLIDASRIVLNLHYYPEAILETTRLSLLLSRGACVVSETSRDPILDKVYKRYCSLVTSDKVVERCQQLLEDPVEIAKWQQRSLEYRDEQPFLKNLPIKALEKLMINSSKNTETEASIDADDNKSGEKFDKLEPRVPFKIVEMVTTPEGASVLKLPLANASDYLHVTLITPTRNRSVFLPLMLRNFRSFDYPMELIEWVIIDDSDTSEAERMQDGLPLSDPRIKYFHYDYHIPIWEKRNLAVEKATGRVIVHMDDDDHYFPESIYAKVMLLNKYRSAGYHCVGSREIGIYHLLDNYSFIMKSQMMGEAGLAYDREFWVERAYDDKDLKFGEGAYFLQGRTDQVLDVPYWFNLIALSHQNNYTQGLRRLNRQEQKKIEQNFFSVWPIETQLFFIALKKSVNKKL